MNKEEFLIKLSEQLRNVLIEPSEKQLEMLYKYKEMLLEWNTKINLTAITEDNEIINKHLVDSIIPNKYLGEKSATIIDIGTGAGFPGIPLKVVNENLDITLLDSLNKRINFLKNVIEELNLKNIEAIHGRAEEVLKNKEYRESYDFAISRAVAPLNVLVEYMLPAIKINGRCICMKGNNAEKEIEEAKKAISILGGRIESINKHILPNTDIERNIIVIKKEKATPPKYPRKAGTPSKEPL